MEGKEEDVRLGANKFNERQPIGTAAQSQDDAKDYKEPPPAPLFEPEELTSWSFYRAGIAEFFATFLFLYITVLTVMGVVRSKSIEGNTCKTVGIQGIAWAFGGMIFALVYCTAGISGGHINPAVTFGLFLARKLSLTRAVFYIVMQCLGAICGAGVVKGFQPKPYDALGGGANMVAKGYTKGDGLGAAPVSHSTDSFHSHHTIQEDLLKILDDTDASIDREAGIQDLDSVIRSFEKEIEVPVTVTVPVVQPELGFLLEASDDELGLPPAAGEKEEIEEAEFSGSGGVKGGLGFEDEIVSNYCWFDNLRCEIKEWSTEEEEEVVALGGLFDHTDVAAELPTAYRSERMPCL